MIRQALTALGIGVAGALVLAVALRDVHASPVDCHDFAMAAGSAADFRDAGADLEKTIRVARDRSKDRTQAELALLEREIRRVFRDKKPRRPLIAETYRRCRAARGAMD